MCPKKAIRKKRKTSPAAQESRKEQTTSRVKWDELDSREQMSVVCNLFINGMKFSEIANTINQTYHTNLKRESTYPILMNAVQRKWIRFVPPPEYELEMRLRRQYAWLDDVRVAHSAQFQDIAGFGAEALIELLKKFYHQNKDVVHIGFAGGHAIRKLTYLFSQMLPQFEGKLPSRLVLHALVAGFDIHEPRTDPNTFFSFFQSSSMHGFDIEFVGLHAPSRVKTEEFRNILESEDICDSSRAAKKVDIIVTSGTCWGDEHSSFRKYMQKSETCFKILDRQNCVGDMLWLPLGNEQPLPLETEIRAMTLFELNDLPNFIRRGKKVLLVLSPCFYCNQTKSSILKAVLNQKEHLITHLVADSRTVRNVLI
jgi:DNA-binding transcriptional regulator LsrR (DeoR family)